MKKRYVEFVEVAEEQLHRALQQEDILDLCAETLADTVQNDGIIHCFGCGHSQMFGEELCFRTGGLVPVNAIMIPQYNIYPKAKLSQIMERQEGVALSVLNTIYTTPHDTMIIVSVSGRNAAVIDMALAAKEKGMKVIALTSIEYSSNVTSRHSSGKKLMDIADIVLDICGIKGDAALSDPRVSERFCSPSTVVGMSLLVGVIGQTIQNLADRGINPPLWVSGNVDRGDVINNEHFKNYKGKVDIL